MLWISPGMACRHGGPLSMLIHLHGYRHLIGGGLQAGLPALLDAGCQTKSV